MKILVVDDSIVFRSQISSSLNGIEGIEVVGTAPNGRIAIQKLEQVQVDLMTLDMEMPELNGIETLKLMRKNGFKTKVIVFSSQTVKGAEKALEALREGADDVVLKPSGDELNFETAQEMIRAALVPKVLQFLGRPPEELLNFKFPEKVVRNIPRAPKRKITSFLPGAVVIASSTGGPTALETIFSLINSPIRRPIFIAQHMPAIFTQILAKRLSEISNLSVREAIDGEIVNNSTVYVAPGDFHMVLEKRNKNIVISLNQDPQRNSVRPAADFLFESASAIYKDTLLGIVLTGMGEDGAVGAKVIRENDGSVLIQSKSTCVVFGMPGAIYANDDYDEIADLEKIGDLLKSVVV